MRTRSGGRGSRWLVGAVAVAACVVGGCAADEGATGAGSTSSAPTTSAAPAGSVPGSAAPAGTTPAPGAAPVPAVVAHRGASAYAPEHTFASYDLAVEQGADYLEHAVS